MTFWLFIRRSRLAAHAPGPDLNADYVRGGANGVTLGRCGGCHACPDVWRMQVPIIGEPYFDAHYAGTAPSEADAIQLHHRAGFGVRGLLRRQVQLGSIVVALPDANLYLGLMPTGSNRAGWHLSYVQPGLGSGWMLYLPAETATVEFEPNAQNAVGVSGYLSVPGAESVSEVRQQFSIRVSIAPGLLEIEPFYA